MGTTARVGLAAALAMIAIGCGRGDGTEDVAVIEDLDLLQAVEAEGSARLSLALDSDSQIDGVDGMEEDSAFITPTHVTASAEGVIAYPDGDLDLSGSTLAEAELPEGIVDEPLPAVAQVFEIRRRDGQEWTRFGTEGDEPSPWVASDADADPDPDPDDDELLDEGFPADPVALLERVRDAARSLVEMGPDEVRGDPVTRYRAEVDEEDVAGGLWSGDDEDDTTSVDVWVDDEDRLRRLTIGGLTLELWDFGVPVEVEAPDEVGEEPDANLWEGGPEVTGDWGEQTRGTTGDREWSVFAAAAEVRGVETTCRTLEVAGDDEMGLGGMAGDVMEDSLHIPMHGDAVASCGAGSSFASGLGSPFFPDPSLQVLASSAGIETSLVGFVVAPRLADGGLRLVLDDGEVVELALDGTGVAVWDADDAGAVARVELDGGAVTCAPTSIPGMGDGGAGFAGTMLFLGVGMEPCVRA